MIQHFLKAKRGGSLHNPPVGPITSRKFYPMMGWKHPENQKTRFIFGLLCMPENDTEMVLKAEAAAKRDGTSIWGGNLPDGAGQFLIGVFPADVVERLEIAFGKMAVESLELSLKPDLLFRYGATDVVEM